MFGIVVALTASAASEALLRAHEHDQAAYHGKAKSRSTIVPCKQSGTIHVDVTHGPDNNRTPLSGALVEVVEAGLWVYSTDAGEAEFTVPVGTYTVRAKKDWYLPDAGERRNQVVVTNGNTRNLTMHLRSLEFHLHLDADRDGNVDDDRIGLATWKWGPDGKGAVILCNNDDDDNSGTADNADAIVNGVGDVADIAPLDIRRAGDGASGLPIGWDLVLSVSNADQANIRIFDARTANGAEIIGPNTGNAHSFANFMNGVNRLELGMEATRYPEVNFDGLVELVLTVSRTLQDGTVKSYTERAKVRVAPWLMTHHVDTAAMVYVADNGQANAGFRNDLQNMVNAAGLGNPTAFQDNNDKWMQDCMEIGYSLLPGGNPLTVVLRTPPDNGLHAFPPTLLGANLGVTIGATGSLSRFDAGGNLEVTPPVKEPEGWLFAGRRFPFGRIYYCSGRSTSANADNGYQIEMDDDLETFLKKQVVQEPFEIDSSWLVIGHVDEVVTFIPVARGVDYKNFLVLIPSAQRAWDILETLNSTGGHNDTLFNNLPVRRRLPLDSYTMNAVPTVQTFLTNGIPGVSLATQNAVTVISLNDLEDARDYCQGKLDAVRKKLTQTLDLDDDQIIEVPVLFAEHGSAVYESVTGNMVNMLVLGTHCIIPRAYGPLAAVPPQHAQTGGNIAIDAFEADLIASLAGKGLTLELIDALYYHDSHGEVHCGTNTRRTPAAANWWEFNG